MSAVVKLPTAASRRVDNYRFADQRRAVVAIRAAKPWPGKYVPPHVREEQRKAKAFAKLERTPELFAVLTMLTAFPADRLGAVVAAADLLLLRDSEGEAAKAGHVLVSEAVALRRAMEAVAAMQEGR